MARPSSSPLAEMTSAEETGRPISAVPACRRGPHPVAAIRDALTRAGVLSAAALARVPDGRRARAIGGVVIVRQRPRPPPRASSSSHWRTRPDSPNAIITTSAILRSTSRSWLSNKRPDHRRRGAEPAGPWVSAEGPIDFTATVRQARRSRHLARLSLARPDRLRTSGLWSDWSLNICAKPRRARPRSGRRYGHPVRNTRTALFPFRPHRQP